MYPPLAYEQTTIKAKIGEELFIARGKVVIAQGWKEVYQHDLEEEEPKDSLSEQTLPVIKRGDCLKVRSLTQTKGETKPPEPFTEGTLLSAMENPANILSQVNNGVYQNRRQKREHVALVATW